jgi:hypothetical protein
LPQTSLFLPSPSLLSHNPPPSSPVYLVSPSYLHLFFPHSLSFATRSSSHSNLFSETMQN